MAAAALQTAVAAVAVSTRAGNVHWRAEGKQQYSETSEFVRRSCRFSSAPVSLSTAAVSASPAMTLALTLMRNYTYMNYLSNIQFSCDEKLSLELQEYQCGGKIKAVPKRRFAIACTP